MNQSSSYLLFLFCILLTCSQNFVSTSLFDPANLNVEENPNQIDSGNEVQRERRFLSGMLQSALGSAFKSAANPNGPNPGIETTFGAKYAGKEKKNVWSNADAPLLTSAQEREGMTAGQAFATGFKDGTSAILDSSAGMGDMIASAAGKGKNRISGDSSFIDPLKKAAIHGTGAIAGSLIDVFAGLTGQQKNLKNLAFLAGAGAGGGAGLLGHAYGLKTGLDGLKVAAVLLNQEKLLGMKGQSKAPEDNVRGATNQLSLINKF